MLELQKREAHPVGHLSHRRDEATARVAEGDREEGKVIFWFLLPSIQPGSPVGKPN
jgi:hypothetical protein